MTVTEDAPAPAPAVSQPTATTPAATGLASVLGTGDHKMVGRVWLAASLLHLVVAGAAALFVAVLRIDPSDLDNDFFQQAVTLRSIGGAFLFLLPLTIGLATLVVPLQVGASTIAFPRAAAAAAWTYLLGGGLVIGAYTIDGGPFGNDVDGVRLFIVAFLLVLLALAVAWICIGTTVLALRAPGMTLRRVPLFAWSSLVGATVWLLVLPVLAGLVLVGYIDVRYGGPNGFISGGGAITLYSRISWAFSQPAVYAFGIPVLGFAGAVVPVFSRTRHQQHRIALFLIGFYGVLAAGAWAVPAFSPDPTPWLYEAPWVGVSFAILLPVLGLVGLWALTMRHGSPRLASPLLFAMAAVLMLLAGLAAGALQAIEPIETMVDGEGVSLFGTTVTTSVASYIVLAAAIAAFGGVVFWAPKIFGRLVPENSARFVALLLLIGTVVWSLPDLVSGILGQPGFPGTPAPDNTDTIEVLNTVSAIGGGVLAAGCAAFVLLVLAALRSKELPGDDPWSGHTLEWATSSPPPSGNFASLPEITSEAPLYDAHQPQGGTS
ncbi:MAG: cbb3-type cytochrome c oxidase subunit I [Acidimicrobiales bacterium]